MHRIEAELMGRNAALTGGFAAEGKQNELERSVRHRGENEGLD